MNEEKMIELVEDVAGLKVGLTSIEDKLDDLARKLLGNGRPGLIADIDGRVSSLERYRAWVLGSAAGVTGVLALLGWIIVTIRK
jgi:hypothetical protein